ncbi:MAG: hypothetical protein M3N68_10100 [Actinomycetota bacterium]|nr:hypothetical protein [Actinomycetota bacterium]
MDDETHARLVAEAARVSPDDRSLPALLSRAHAMSHRDWQRLDARATEDGPGVGRVVGGRRRRPLPGVARSGPPANPEPAEVDSVDRRLSRTIEVDGRTRPYLDQLTWNVVVGMAGARDRFDQAIALEGVQGTGVR